MPLISTGLKFLAIVSVTVNATHSVTTTKENGNRLNIIVWICPDQDLYKMVENAIQQSSTVDDITSAIQKSVVGYRNLLWSANALIYTRATADLMPTKRTTSKNLCFVSVPQENIIVYVAAIARRL
ncbi:hypothetical protein Y032_0118g710 [Ancylostoma ceylanicum]|uniref:Uncharacterized protein n=1 Tax=Ancylostoma ceylanicum TaxID=53326 RepID=A0A016TBG6_9BILA|nr:hypothetical protein Y032_0118g710 [Ancylostoma ceylanicum]